MDDASRGERNTLEEERQQIQHLPSASYEFHSRLDDGATFFAAAISTIKGLKDAKKTPPPNQDTFNYLYIDEVGWSESPVLILGVFDGHGRDGHDVSMFVSVHLIEEIHKEVSRHKRRSDFRDVGILRAFERVDEMVRKRDDTQDSGTTAVVAVVCYEEIIIANVGDSGAAFMFRDGTVRYVTRDHSPNDPRETRRINRIGGAVRNCEGTHRVFNIIPETGELDGGLALSRAFGDLSLETAGVNSNPDITSYPFGMRPGPDGWRERPMMLILATDGLWDVVDEAAIPHLVAESNTLTMSPLKQKERMHKELAHKHMHPLSAATSLIASHARSCWMVDTNGQYVDDITVMNVFLSFDDVSFYKDKDDEEEDEDGGDHEEKSPTPRLQSRSRSRSQSTSTKSTHHRLDKITARKAQAEAMTSAQIDALIKRCTKNSEDCQSLGHFSIVHETLLARRDDHKAFPGLLRHTSTRRK